MNFPGFWEVFHRRDFPLKGWMWHVAVRASWCYPQCHHSAFCLGSISSFKRIVLWLEMATGCTIFQQMACCCLKGAHQSFPLSQHFFSPASCLCTGLKLNGMHLALHPICVEKLFRVFTCKLLSHSRWTWQIPKKILLSQKKRK